MAESHFGRFLRMQALPGCEYHLYTILRQHFQLESLREVCILGMRCMYTLWHDPALRQVLLNLLQQLQEEREAIKRSEALPHKYEL